MSQQQRITCTAIALLFFLSGSAAAQSPTNSNQAGRTIRLVHQRGVPEASLPCTPEEAKWWQNLREAASAVLDKRDGKKEKEKFLALIQEGQEKSYQPPIPDQRAVVLTKRPPAYSESARRRKINGSVALLVELRPDGYVGEVEVTKGLDPSLDQNSIEAARGSVFLPSVKDRKFVVSKSPMEMTFDIY